MAKGSRGERRSDDLLGMSVTIAKIAIGETSDDQNFGYVRFGYAGVVVRAKEFVSGAQNDIARAATNGRWL